MNLPKIQFSALIDGVVAKKDRTLTLKIGTQEMTADDASYIFSLMGNQVYIALAETGIESMDVPEIVPELKGEKTPSQRLKSVIYVAWNEKTDKKIPFPRYYEDYMSKLIEQLKDKLN